MKKVILSVSAFLLCLASQAQTIDLSQNVIATAGGFAEDANGNSLSFTVGEMIIETVEGDGIILTQGFQQPNLPQDPNAINTTTAMGTTASVFPNPFSVEFYTMLDMPVAGNVTFEVTDLNGKLVATKNAAQPIGKAYYTFTTNTLAAGMYNLTVRASNGFTTSVKLNKVQ